MQNHMSNKATIVPNGIALDEPCDQTKKLRTKNVRKMKPGYRVAVNTVIFFHSAPLRDLYVLDEKYPAGTPMRTKSSNVAVSNPPRLAGERKPSIAHRIEMHDMPRSCMPVPREQQRRTG